MSSAVDRVCESIDAVMQRRGVEIRSEIRAFVARVLQQDEHSIADDVGLIELGFGSLDLLELTFVIEKMFDVRIDTDGFRLLLRRELHEDAEDGDEVSETGLAWLRRLMPEAADKLVPGVKAAEISDVYTVGSLVRMVAWKLAEADGTAPR